jgi:hypothetical protein
MAPSLRARGLDRSASSAIPGARSRASALGVGQRAWLGRLADGSGPHPWLGPQRVWLGPQHSRRGPQRAWSGLSAPGWDRWLMIWAPYSWHGPQCAVGPSAFAARTPARVVGHQRSWLGPQGLRSGPPACGPRLRADGSAPCRGFRRGRGLRARAPPLNDNPRRVA